MAVTDSLLFLLLNAHFFLNGSLAQLGRPSFAGATGGTWESYVGQRIPPGTPWPARAEDYSTTTSTTTSSTPLVDQTTLNIETKVPVTPYPVNITTETYTSVNDSSVQSSTSPGTPEDKPIRPSSAGQTGGTWESLVGQRIPPGTPWPVKGENITNNPITETQSSTTAIPTTSENKPDRPSFAGQTGGTWESLVGQKIPPGTPWPVKDEDGSTNLTTVMQSSTPIVSTISQEKPNRPSFAGQTGGTWESLVGQKIPPGTPWPVKDEDGSKNLTTVMQSSTPTVSTTSQEKPNRPSFAGQTGGTWESLVGQKIPPGTPWPVKGEDITKNPITEMQFSTTSENKPNRPSFAGQTGGTWESLVGQIIPPGTPWPAQLGTNGTSSSETSTAVSLDQTSKPSGVSTILGYKPNRPPYAGETGGNWENYVGQVVLNGTPWPPKAAEGSATIGANGSKDISTGSTVSEESTIVTVDQTSSKPDLDHELRKGKPNQNNKPNKGQISPPMIFPADDVTPSDSRPSVVLEYKPNRPPFAGNASGSWENLVGQVVPPTQANNDSPTVPEELPFVYLALDREDIKAAIRRGQGLNNSNVRLFALDLNLDGLETKSVSGTDDKDPIKATDQLLMAEKCDGEKDNKKELPVLSVLVDVIGLKNAVREYYLEKEKEGVRL